MRKDHRRRFLIASSALIAAPLVRAQQAAKIHRFGTISPSATAVELADPAAWGRNPMRAAMQERGYVEGRNLIFDRSTAEGVPGRIPDIVADLVRFKADVIIVPHISIAKIAAGVTRIVSASGDPIVAGVVQSLDRPGGNVTGFFAAGTGGVEKKRLQLLRDLVPKARRVAFVISKTW